MRTGKFSASKGLLRFRQEVQQYRGGGGIVGQDMATATALAKAARLLDEAIFRNVARIEWEHDDVSSYEDGVESSACILFVNDEPCASVGGIQSDDRSYGRRIEAELALQCKDALSDAMRGVRDQWTRSVPKPKKKLTRKNPPKRPSRAKRRH